MLQCLEWFKLQGKKCSWSPPIFPLDACFFKWLCSSRLFCWHERFDSDSETVTD